MTFDKIHRGERGERGAAAESQARWLLTFSCNKRGLGLV